MAGTAKLPGKMSAPQKKLGGLGILSIQSQNSALLTKFLTKIHSDTSAPWAVWFRRRYGWNGSRDLGDTHRLDTHVWKDIVAGLKVFRSVTKVSVGNGPSTAFWADHWTGDATLQDRFPVLFSHSTRTNINVAAALTSDFRGTLGLRLSLAAETDLRTLANELTSVVLHHDSPDDRCDRLTNKKLSNKSIYVNSFRHLRIDAVAEKVWRSAAPLKCKVFGWISLKKRLLTNERRFRHRLSTTATCLSCPQDEDTDHMLLLCPRAWEVWTFFFPEFSAGRPSNLADLWAMQCRDFEETTIVAAITWNIWKRRNARTFNGVDEDMRLVSHRLA
nr:uncharacterized protein LOC127325637 [Lolium perenne]